jgi:hypothetical protein
MKISFENFRGFKKCGPIQIRPITLLVGENSSGKTSFQAALRYLLTLSAFSSPESAGFNQPPFFLGGFEDIAYSRLGRTAISTRDFSISIQRPTPPMNRQHSFVRGELPPEYEIFLQFSEWLGQPALKMVRFAAASKSFSIDLVKMTLTLNNEEQPDRFYRYDFVSDVHPQLEQARKIPQTAVYLFSILLPLTFEKDFQRNNRILINSNAEAETLSSFFDIFATSYQVFFSPIGSERQVSALSPMRTEPKRVYEVLDTRVSPTGTHVPMRLAQQKIENADAWASQRAYFAKFGKDAGLFSNIDIRRLGSTQNDPFQIMVSVGGKKRNIMDVGYGVSQVLPLLYEMAEKRPKLLLIQQPEVHLHPRAQAELGSLIVEAYTTQNHTFVIETHSDFIVDRIRNHIRLGEIKLSDVSLLYFHRHKSEIAVSEITLDDHGNVIDPPSEYRDFFYREEKDLLGF